MLDEAKLQAYEGHFASIEHFYQGMKFHTVSGNEAARVRGREYARKFLLDGEYGRDARVAKSKGGKGAMKTLAFTLDSTTWNRVQDTVMSVAIRARSSVDPLYTAALKQSAQGDWLWLHFDRSGAKSYWGGHVSKETGEWKGRNRRVELLMQQVGKNLLF
jgi:hypothetical protein